MDRIKQLNVFYHERKVGTLALYKERLAAFEYDKEWIESGFPVSPFSLPLEKRVFLPKADPSEVCLVCSRIVFPMDGGVCW